MKRFFGIELAELLAGKIAAVEPAFDTRGFVGDVRASNFTELELLARVDLLARHLREHLSPSYPDAIRVLQGIFGPENPNETGMFTFWYWLWPVGTFIAEYGLEHHAQSIEAIGELTKRNTGEFAIRPYIVVHPDYTLNAIRDWSRSPNFHLRRLASEGLRPRLPWAKKLRLYLDDPAPVFEVLDTLRDDTCRFVQKSVANNVNDYIKDNRPAALALLSSWATDATTQRRWTIKHALRNEIKRGADDALAIIETARG